MNVKNVEKENGSAKVTVEIAKDEFQTALDKAYAKIRKDIMIPASARARLRASSSSACTALRCSMKTP